MTTAPPDSSTSLDRSARVDRSMLVIAFVIAIFGDVVGFNQLATQSTFDAIIQLCVFVVGFAGVVEAARRLVFARRSSDRLIGIAFAVLSLAAIITWSAGWATGVQSLVVLIGGLLVAACGVTVLWQNRHEHSSESSQVGGLLALAQGVVMVWFSVLALGAINGPLFS